DAGEVTLAGLGRRGQDVGQQILDRLVRPGGAAVAADQPAGPFGGQAGELLPGAGCREEAAAAGAGHKGRTTALGPGPPGGTAGLRPRRGCYAQWPCAVPRWGESPTRERGFLPPLACASGFSSARPQKRLTRYSTTPMPTRKLSRRKPQRNASWKMGCQRS